MKTVTKLFLLVFLVIAGLKGSAQCLGNYFAYNVGTDGQVDFQNYYFYGDTLGTPAIFIWNFGDGSDTIHNSNYSVSHTYATGGTYTVSLEEINTAVGCDSVFTQSVVVNRCHGAAQFSVNQIGFGDYSYSAINGGAFPGATYSWSFGDGGTSASATPTHQFSASGAYDVVLIATDAALGCVDTSFQDGIPSTQYISLCSFPVSITDSLISGNNTYATFDFYTNAAASGYVYMWNFGDGITNGSYANITHPYYSSTNYNVSVTISDATTGCSTTASIVLDVNLCGIRYAGFSNNGNGLTQSFSAYYYDSIGSSIASYDWTFAGASPSTGSGQNVSGITYPAPGSYNACIYITTTAGCIDTICQQVNVSYPVYTISGIASKSGGSGFIGAVYLIKQDSIGHLTLVDSTAQNFDSTSIGFSYSFYNIASADTYYVKAALNSNDADYANYLPTYYGDVLTWGTATPIVITNNSVSNADISLIAGSNPGGPGFVGGYVSQGAGLIIGNAGNGNAKSLGDPIAGVQVNLLTSGNAAVAYTFTDANGHYQFPNLALGSYKIYVEQLNKIPSPLDFTLTAENPVDSGANMSVNSHSATGIDNVGMVQITEVYPNPVVNTVQLQIGCQQNADATLKIVDVLGRTNLTQNIKLTSGQNTAEINMAGFAAGVYQLVIQAGKEQHAYKIVKAK